MYKILIGRFLYARIPPRLVSEKSSLGQLMKKKKNIKMYEVKKEGEIFRFPLLFSSPPFRIVSISRLEGEASTGHRTRRVHS